MTSATDLILFFFLLTLFIYWLSAIRAKELATQQAKSACTKVHVEFLDETVSIKKVRLRRDSHGHMAFYREYQFEFTSTGEHRYKGRVALLGKFFIATEMEPYQVNTADE